MMKTPHSLAPNSFGLISLLARACAALVLTCGIAWAQPESAESNASSGSSEDEAARADDAVRGGPPQGITITLEPSGAFIGERDFDSGVGSIESTTFGGSLEFGIPIDARSRLTLGLRGASTDVDISVAPGAIGGTNAAAIMNEFDSITEFGGSAFYFRSLENGPRIFVGGGVLFASEGGADLSDSLTWNALGGFQFQVNENLSIGGGVGIFSRLEDSVRVIPIPQITLKIDDRWTFGTERAGFKLEYKANDEFSYGALVRFEGQDYRIDDDNTIAPGGAVSSAGIPITAFMEFRGGRESNISFRGEVGVVVAGEMEIFNAAGAQIVDDDMDAGVYIGARLRIAFR